MYEFLSPQESGNNDPVGQILDLIATMQRTKEARSNPRMVMSDYDGPSFSELDEQYDTEQASLEQQLSALSVSDRARLLTTASIESADLILDLIGEHLTSEDAPAVVIMLLNDAREFPPHTPTRYSIIDILAKIGTKEIIPQLEEAKALYQTKSMPKNFEQTDQEAEELTAHMHQDLSSRINTAIECIKAL